MEEKQIEFSVTIGVKELYRFLLYSVYHSLQGGAAVFISVMVLLILALTWQDSNPAMKVLLLILGLYYIIIKPISLYMKARVQAMQEVFKIPLNFSADEGGIHVQQGEESADLPWDGIYRIVSAKKDVYLYTTRIYAYTIPKDQTREAWKELLALAEKKGCRIK